MKISVITVCFNSADTIKRTIDSVRAQTYDNYEYIVIDGCSTDGTVDIVKENMDLVNIFISEPDSGIYDAMNKGIKASTGDVIAFINADDFYDSRALEIAASYLNNGFDFVFGAVRVGDKVISRYTPSKAWYTNGFSTKHTVGFFVKKTCHDKLGLYRTKYKISADLDFFYKLVKSNFRGIASKPDEVFGEFTLDGVSSQNWFNNFWEDILIRHDQGQNRFVLFLLINMRIIWNLKKFIRVV
jgi:glycosyltransferase involved in cell wall biosynthesis